MRFDDIEEAARLAGEIFVEVYRGLESRRVAPAETPAAIRRALAGTLDHVERGVGLVRALEDFRAMVLPRSMGTPHPLYAGLVNSSPLPGAALADLLISALNNNGGAFGQSPAMTACEEEVARAFARLLGYPADADGMVLPGGSFANLQAIVIARARTFGEGVPAEARLYTSEAAHFSVARAGRIAGLSRAQIVAIPTDARGAMDPTALRERVRADRAAGARPFAVVATLGTTGTGAIDPIDAIADLCAEEETWLHVDACYGGAALLVPALRTRIGDVARADSIAIDPHKWFFIPVTAALLLVRERGRAKAVFGADAASYIPGAGDDAWRRGIPTSRRSSGLAIWMALRAHGWSTIREAVERDIALTRLLERRLAARGFDILPGGELSIACARRPVAGLDAEKTDAFQVAVANHVVASGRAWFATVRHAGATWLRFNWVNLHTREEHVEEMAALVEEAALFEERNVRRRAR